MTTNPETQATFHSSERWIPPCLEAYDVSNFRYIPGITDDMRAKIDALTKDDNLRGKFNRFLPQRTQTGAYPAKELLLQLAQLNEDESRAGSRIFDEHLAEEIGEGVLVMQSDLNAIDTTQLNVAGQAKQVMYESMPTDVHFETIGGFSLATIHIKDGDPETVENEHVHNGGRMVIALSENSTLVLPGKQIQLQRGQLVWMPPFVLHSFQQGDFLALHTSEAGFEHPEAFIPQFDPNDYLLNVDGGLAAEYQTIRKGPQSGRIRFACDLLDHLFPDESK